VVKKRSEVEEGDKWNVKALFLDIQGWERAFHDLTKGKRGKTWWPELAEYQGKIKEGATTLKRVLKEMFSIKRELVKLYAYAYLRHDEDLSDKTYKELFSRISLLYFDFQNEISWIQPEILQLSDTLFKKYLQEKTLEEYRIYLQKLALLKPYTLTADKEKLLSLAKKPLEASKTAFSVFNDAELKFGTVLDERGEEKSLTHGTYGLYLQSSDLILRRNSALQLHQRYKEFENTLTELIKGEVLSHVFEAEARGYPSSLHAALTPYSIPVEVYDNLVKTVRSNLSTLHRYVKLRKRLLKKDSLHFYDLYVSLIPHYDKHFSFDTAKEMVLLSVQPLGERYCQILQRGLKQELWVDRFENEGKRSGAYSGGCYDSFPYILMNFHGTLRDVFTLAHEAGHSMHSYYSNHNQPFMYSHYPTFVAEVASTFNEELLFRTLLERAQTKDERCYLLNQRIDDIRTTLFRQTLFAEFELQIHLMTESGVPLTAASLKALHRRLNEEYYGPELFLDSEIEVEYLRIPHFYYNFYVYQYATGISAAHALVEQVLLDEGKSCQEYLKFLSSGSSYYPIDLLKMAGVDMKTSAPIQTLIDYFSSLVDTLEQELV